MIVFTFYSVLHILGDEHQMEDAGSWESNYRSFIRGDKDSNNIFVVSHFPHCAYAFIEWTMFFLLTSKNLSDFLGCSIFLCKFAHVNRVRYLIG